jgi:hypothetical protein
MAAQCDVATEIARFRVNRTGILRQLHTIRHVATSAHGNKA